MLNDASFSGSPYRLRSSRVHHDDSVSGRRSASSFDGGHTGDQLERRLFTASPLDDRTHHEAKRSGLDAIMGNGIDGSHRQEFLSRTTVAWSRNRLHPVSR